MATSSHLQQPPRLPDRVAIYGAGGFWRRLALALKEAGTEVVGFVDQAGRVPPDSRALSVQDVASAQVPLVMGISDPHAARRLLSITSGGSKKAGERALPLARGLPVGECSRS